MNTDIQHAQNLLRYGPTPHDRTCGLQRSLARSRRAAESPPPANPTPNGGSAAEERTGPSRPSHFFFSCRFHVGSCGREAAEQPGSGPTCHLAQGNAPWAPWAPPVANVMAGCGATVSTPLTNLPEITK